MARIAINPANLYVGLTKPEKFFGLHGDLVVPGKHILGAQPVPKTFLLTLGMRLPGTGFPGLVAMGTYWKPENLAYVSWRKGQEALQINLQGHKYARIIVGVDNAAALAEEINTAITGC